MLEDLFISLAQLCAEFDRDYGNFLVEAHKGEIIQYQNLYRRLMERKNISKNLEVIKSLYSNIYYEKRIARLFIKKLKDWELKHSKELAIEYL